MLLGASAWSRGGEVTVWAIMTVFRIRKTEKAGLRLRLVYTGQIPSHRVPPFARVERGFRTSAGVRVKSEVVMSTPSHHPVRLGSRGHSASSDTQQRLPQPSSLELGSTVHAVQRAHAAVQHDCQSQRLGTLRVASDTSGTRCLLEESERLGNGKAPDQGYKVGERTRRRD